MATDGRESSARSPFPRTKSSRGGSWIAEGDKCRSATREGSTTDWIKLDPQAPKSIWWLTSAEHVGFRIVRPIEEQDNLKGFRSTITRDSSQ